MINVTIDKLVKDNFYRIYNQAIAEAQNHFQKSFLPHLNGKSLFEQISLLKKDMEKDDDNTDNSPAYLYRVNHNTDEWLLKLYSSRTVILNIDEGDELYKGIFNGTLHSLIVDKYHELKKSIPSYSYADFLNGLYNPFFFELEFYSLATEEDYNKIREWQAENFIKMISIEMKVLIESIQNECATISDPLTIINFNKDYFDNSFTKTKYSSASELIAALSKFTFLKGYDFSQLDNNEVLIDFDYFSNEKIPWKSISPGLINKVQDKLNQVKPVSAFSSSPIIFFSLNKVIVWLEEVLNGRGIFEHYQEPALEDLFYKVLEEANNEADSLIYSFEVKHDIDNIETDEAKLLYINTLNDLRHEYNDHQDDFSNYYLKGVFDEDVLKLAFITNSFFDNDPVSHSEQMKRAIIMVNRMLHYIQSLNSITGSRRFPVTEEDGNVIEIMYLMHNMALDVDLYKRLEKLMNDTIREFHQSGVPFEILNWNMHEGMKEIFNESIDRLLRYLEDSLPSNKVLYIQTRLKQLKQRELQYKQMQGIYPDLDKNTFTKLFIDFLEIEADYIRETKDVKILPAFNPVNKSKLLSENNLRSSFGYKSKDKEPLLSIIKLLCVKIDLLDDRRTSAEDLVKILICDDFTKEQGRIYLKCETVQFAYIVSNLSRSFQSLTPKLIEESALFYSRKNNLITAQNLYSNKIDNPKEKEAIDKILKQMP